MLHKVKYVAGCVCLGKAGKNLFDAKTVGVGVAVGHGIHDQHDVAAIVVSAACCRFNPEAGCYAREENLGHAALSQVLMQIRADECAWSLFADQMIVWVLLQFRDELGPVGRK